MGELEQLTMWEDRIDKEQTQRNVVEFLTRVYPRERRRAGVCLTSLQSPQITDLPKGMPSGNSNESKQLRRLGAAQVVRETKRAIDACDRDCQPILRMIADGLNNEQIIMEITYERSQYYNRLRPNALMQFAEAYQGEELIAYKK